MFKKWQVIETAQNKWRVVGIYNNALHGLLPTEYNTAAEAQELSDKLNGSCDERSKQAKAD